MGGGGVGGEVKAMLLHQFSRGIYRSYIVKFLQPSFIVEQVHGITVSGIYKSGDNLIRLLLSANNWICPSRSISEEKF